MAARTDAAVLLVDDRPENLLALRAVLEPLECRMVAVTSGEEALKALLQDEFAVVLLDVQMPGMDGFETAELIKGRRRTRAVPIIFVTAISKERHHVFRGYEAGAVDYLFKPYDPELLKSKVRVFLELDARGRVAARSEALLRASFAFAPIGMARLDLEGRFAEVNRAFAALVGHDPAALRDRLLETVVSGDDLPSPDELLAGSLDGEEHEALLVTAAGEEIPALLTYAVARPGDGLPAALVVQVQDLRVRRRAEQERDQRIREQVARTEAERITATLTALQSISDAAMGTLALEELVADVLNRIADALVVDTAAVTLSEDDGTSVVHQIAGGEVGGAERRWYSVVAAEELPGTEGSGPLGEPMASTLRATLSAHGDVLGTLQVGALFPRAFTDDEQRLLELAADRVGIAIVRARQHQRDRAITEELQRSLLPADLPEVRGATTSSRYFPGGAGERVGGDWYDVVVQPDGRLLLAIGDVAGHGIGAATAMGQLRSALRAYALDGYGPGAVLERLNTFQIDSKGHGMATVALVAVDLATGQARIASAGHLPPLLADGDGATTWLEPPLGPPLGAVDGMTYAEGEAEIPPGAIVVLYTDGLVERRREPLDRGLERLRAALADGPEETEALSDRLLARTLPDEPAEDDVTLLVLRLVGDRRRRADRRKSRADGDAEPSARQLGSGTWPHHVTRSARVELPSSPRAGGAVRRIVAETLAGAVTAAELVSLQAVVSEIVNNAVVHGEGDGKDEVLVFHLAATSEIVRVEITNDGPPFVPPEPSAREDPGGFGLIILDKLASRWGLDFDPGVCVWFELDRGVLGGV